MRRAGRAGRGAYPRAWGAGFLCRTTAGVTWRV